MTALPGAPGSVTAGLTLVALSRRARAGRHSTKVSAVSVQWDFDHAVLVQVAEMYKATKSDLMAGEVQRHFPAEAARQARSQSQALVITPERPVQARRWPYRAS